MDYMLILDISSNLGKYGIESPFAGVPRTETHPTMEQNPPKGFCKFVSVSCHRTSI